MEDIFESQHFITELLRAEMNLNKDINMEILNQLVEEDEKRRKVLIQENKIKQLMKKKNNTPEEIKILFNFYQEKEKEYQKEIRDISRILLDIKRRKAYYAVLGLEQVFPRYIECSGIYCIKVEDKIVYIGKSKNIKERLIQHCREIVNANTSTIVKGNKYELLHAIVDMGRDINFEVLEKCDEKELDINESKWIQKELPILNTQVPIMENGKVKILKNEKKIDTLMDFIQVLEKEEKNKEVKKKKNIKHIKEVFGEEGCIF